MHSSLIASQCCLFSNFCVFQYAQLIKRVDLSGIPNCHFPVKPGLACFIGAKGNASRGDIRSYKIYRKACGQIVTTNKPGWMLFVCIECVDLHDVWNKHCVVSSLKDVFENVASQNIIDFSKETLFYKQL